MVRVGSVTVAGDGGVLISIFHANLSPDAETLVSVRDRRIRIEQGQTVFADFELPEGEESAADALRATTDICLVEVTGTGWIEHTRIRKV